jgi:hypothetical protein
MNGPYNDKIERLLQVANLLDEAIKRLPENETACRAVLEVLLGNVRGRLSTLASSATDEK